MLKASNTFLLFLLSVIGGFLYAQKGMKPAAGTERRIALVIGNKDYQKLNPLRNPLNDATDMAVALEQLGFEVIQTTNADYRAFLNAVNRFKDRLSNSDVALFYYSGHGLSYAGKNYLMPTDADITCLEQIEEYGISLNRILGDITAKGVKNSFVLLDACRNVPNLKVCDNTKKDINVNIGLAKPTNNPRGSMVVYATEEGSTADDNVSEKNGLFTAALLKYLTLPNVGIRSILDQTSIEVEKRSNGGQSPGRYDKLQGDFVFVTQPTAPIPVTKTEPYTPPKREEPTGSDVQIVRIKSIKESMKFNLKEFTVIAGKPVELIFENLDAMQHNLVIIKPKSTDIVGNAADKMITQKDAAEKNYVPNLPQVIAFTPLVNPDQTYRLTFTTPAEPGNYPYICTFPGHWRLMNGVMKVVKNATKTTAK